jgi:thiamine-phosphate pyrophosphorylase
MKHQEKKITGGIYLVVDPAMNTSELFSKLQQAIAGGLGTIQIWDRWQVGADKKAIIGHIKELAYERQIPVLINNNWELLKEFELDGIHLDQPADDLEARKAVVGRKVFIGLTCGNELETVEWAIANKLDYISFCSMFPSKSAGACELVSPHTVSQARQMTSMPLFVAGGISLQNIDQLKSTGMDGVAVISSVLKAAKPAEVVGSFREKLEKNNNLKFNKK